MSTQEEKKMTDEELINAAEETVENTENVENTQEQEEPLSEMDQLKAQLAEAEAKIAELQDRYLRQAAEFDNYRKRTMKEKAELIKSAAEKVMVAELPIVDDMDRALDNMEKGMDAEEIIKAILSDFEVEVLEKRPVEYRCYCSRDRVTRALISMGRGEMESLIEEQGEADLTCQFCDAVYHYSKEELEALLAQM